MGNWITRIEERDADDVNEDIERSEALAVQARTDQWAGFWIWIANLRNLFLDPRPVLADPEPPAESKTFIIELDNFGNSAADLVSEPLSGSESDIFYELESESAIEQDSNTSLCNYYIPEVEPVPETLMVVHDLEIGAVVSLPEPSAKQISNDVTVINHLPVVSPERETLTEVVSSKPLGETATVLTPSIPFAEHKFKVNVVSRNFRSNEYQNFGTSSPWLLRLRYSKFAMFTRLLFFVVVCSVVFVLYLLNSIYSVML